MDYEVLLRLVVKDKNGKVMLRTLSLFVFLDVLKFVDEAARQLAIKSLIGQAIITFCKNGIALPEGQLTFMAVAGITIGNVIPDTDVDIAPFLNGGYDSAIFPSAELPEEFVVDYPMYRRAKYAIESAVSTGVGYYKTPEDVYNADPVAYQETYAFPILTVFKALNGGDIGNSKLYTDFKRTFWYNAPLQTDHVQARGSRV